jgi:hypothetical protein
VVEVSKTGIRPNAGLQLVASDQFSWALQKNLQHLEGLILQFDTASELTDLPGGKIDLKRPKAYRMVPVIHCGLRDLRKV